MSETLDYTKLSAGELDALLDLLEAEEADISGRRRRMHDRIDFARQTAAHDTVAAQRLEKLLADERTLAEERREVHARISQLKAARRLVS